MNIMHYTIGIPPLRKGGAVDYVINLAKSQQSIGNNVMILYPGSLKFIKKQRLSIKKIKKIDSVQICELSNPLPISIDNGFYSYEAFMKKKNISEVINFIKLNKIEVLHLHTITGLPLEVIECIKNMGVKVFYTTHDYIGLSANRLFYFNEQDFSNNNTDKFWYFVNHSIGHKRIKTFIFQSKLYPLCRALLKKVIKILPMKNMANKTNYVNDYVRSSDVEQESIENLRKYYENIFSYVDLFLFNSTVSRDVFNFNLKNIRGKVVHITNMKNVNIVRRQMRISEKKIRVGYIGPYFTKYKGFYLMITLAKMFKDKSKYEFVFMGDDKKVKGENIVDWGSFKEKSEAYAKIDLLVIASDWKETFGLIGLEALKYGVPVFCSENAGFRDVISSNYVFSDINELYEMVKKINDYPSFYEKYFENLKKDTLEPLDDHADELVSIYANTRRL